MASKKEKVDDPKQKQVQKYLTIKLSNGTSKQLKFRGKTEEEAIEKRAKAKAEYEAGLLIINEKTIFSRWYEEWFEVYQKPNADEKGQCVNIDFIIKKYYMPTLGNMVMKDIRLSHIQRCANLMKGMNHDYVMRGYNAIKSIFRIAVGEDIINKDPTLLLKMPETVPNKERRALTQEERDRLKKTIPRHEKGVMFGMMLACGLRPGEVRAFPVFNLKKEKNEIKITQACKNKSNKVGLPKNKKSRTIPIPDWFIPFLNDIPIDDSPYLFHNDDDGSIISYPAFLRGWHSFMREMDIAAGAKLYRNKIIIHAIAQDITPYNLRHTYCTELAEKGVDLRTAQYLMGHSDIRMTANIYSHVTDKMYNDARMLINS